MLQVSSKSLRAQTKPNKLEDTVKPRRAPPNRGTLRGFLTPSIRVRQVL